MADRRELLSEPSEMSSMTRPHTLGDLKASGYRSESVKDELRRNLIARLRSGEPLFPGILGYEETVLPQIQNAILSRHDILLLGLRGQAKTRLLRQLVHLLDDALPIIAGSEVNDDPLNPVSHYARELVHAKGDETPIEWVGRDRRFTEKLATPDVTIADLIGEIDMIKHAEGRYLSNEATLHFGLIPRANRGIFCMNELPDLAPKIQVGMFNVLEERDVQVRGFPIRLNLDLCMVFSANPEDYTNRGRIVTPLKDRIGSVIRTHYPLTRELGMAISDAEAWTDRGGENRLFMPAYMKELIEEFARAARTSGSVNQQSGVSVRMSICNLENCVSSAERRSILQGEEWVVPRPSDLAGLSAGSRGKIELNLTEDDGQEDDLVERLRAEAVKVVFAQYFDVKSFRQAVEHFDGGKTLELDADAPARAVMKAVEDVPQILPQAEQFVQRHCDAPSAEVRKEIVAGVVEFILDGLHANNKLNKKTRSGSASYRR
jgi:magnesium chelatase subunit I